MIYRGKKVITPAAICLVMLLAIAFTISPFSDKSYECAYCGKSKHSKSRIGITFHSKISENEVSLWLRTMGVQDHDHLWIGHASTFRNTWFGEKGFGCGPGPLRCFYQKQDIIGTDKALEFIQDFQNKLSTSGKSDAMRYYSDQQLEALMLFVHSTNSGSDQLDLD